MSADIPLGALAARPLEEGIDDVVHRGKADGLVVLGAAMGRPAHLEDAQRAKVIVETFLKRGGIALSFDRWWAAFWSTDGENSEV